ncbi:uncharacterized protein MELLADRAFT_89606 [Melampsora larici-populina 98AG31]|uniref:GCM domain-containing protein n=1 Tax=Melampsora larici-populina (strain 98AG31 / pathotype 3-4-7) TaxID=747676 RepID=F4RTY9_MELLP|nr:uncharacterized protein MELLADRAFT_89606 [Melampsora larici-populina 98AG31]EGG04179.1 hypothetical protein MELLADRAFT_89606 [Melampsora larici-populina 98AG31]
MSDPSYCSNSEGDQYSHISDSEPEIYEKDVYKDEEDEQVVYKDKDEEDEQDVCEDEEDEEVEEVEFKDEKPYLASKNLVTSPPLQSQGNKSSNSTNSTKGKPPLTSPPLQSQGKKSSISTNSTKGRKVAIKVKKTFRLPLDRPSFETFIDDNTTLDDEGYPLFPNGNTVCLRLSAKQKFTNWGTFGFTYTSSGGKSKGPGDWRTVRYSCLGVIVCKSLGCDYLGSPPTAAPKRAEWMSKPQKCPAARCTEELQYIECNDTLCRLDEHVSGWGIIRHSGIHNHRWPRRGKPDKLSLAKFAKRVVENPDVGPLRHKVGRAPAGKKEIVTASNIHAGFGNLHRTGYYRRKLLGEAGVIPEKSVPGAADNFIMDMYHWSERGLNVVSCSMKRVNMHMTFQTDWMHQQLMARDEDNRVYGGGLLSDVTYKFFKNGYLLSTSMYHEDLRRWIPILLTWLKGMTENHYAAHFSTLMKQFKHAEITVKERDTLVRQVVDFSLAQANRFVKAYMKVFKETDPAVALSKLQGCHEHF